MLCQFLIVIYGQNFDVTFNVYGVRCMYIECDAKLWTTLNSPKHPKYHNIMIEIWNIVAVNHLFSFICLSNEFAIRFLPCNFTRFQQNWFFFSRLTWKVHFNLIIVFYDLIKSNIVSCFYLFLTQSFWSAMCLWLSP